MVSYKTIIENPEQINFENHSEAWFKEFNKPAVDGESFNHTVKIFQLLVESTVQLEAN